MIHLQPFQDLQIYNSAYILQKFLQILNRKDNIVSKFKKAVETTLSKSLTLVKAQAKLIKDGDKIKIDIPSRKIELLVDENEMNNRRNTMEILPPKVTKGYLAKYCAAAKSASLGAVTGV